LLNDPEWREWSDYKIGEVCKVDHITVAKYRNHTSEISSMDSQPTDDKRIFIHPKTGKKSTMKICKVSAMTVGRYRESITSYRVPEPSPSEVRKFSNKKGTVSILHMDFGERTRIREERLKNCWAIRNGRNGAIAGLRKFVKSRNPL